MNIINNKLLLSLIVSATLFCSGTRSEPVNINVTGKVVAATCTIDNHGIYNVDFGKNIKTSALSQANSSTPWQAFNIILSRCPAEISHVTVGFSGRADPTDDSRYANMMGISYAQNVSIELQKITGSINAGNGKNISTAVKSDRKAIFDMQARVYSKMGDATPGNITAIVIMNFSYN